jgi:uncharacterized membrane protein YphA (DoxX/SURF4 family)
MSPRDLADRQKMLQPMISARSLGAGVLSSRRSVMDLFRIVVTILMCAFLFAVGPLRLAGIPIARRDATKFGIPLPYYRLFGAVEILGGASLLAGLVYRPVGATAAVILTLLGLGAVYVHVRAAEPLVKVILSCLTTASLALLAAVSVWPMP